jgi:hypothetical protein
MRTSNALDLEAGVFTKRSPRAIARSLKRSADQSRRRKSAPFRSAMSMLNFHINRGGKGLSASQRRVLDRAKDELRKLYGRKPHARKTHGEFVREEIRHVRQRKHGARSPQQAIAIGLSKARRAGVKRGPPPSGKKVSRRKGRPSTRRARAIGRALRREPHRTTSRRALARQTHRAALRRGHGGGT